MHDSSVLKWLGIYTSQHFKIGRITPFMHGSAIRLALFGGEILFLAKPKGLRTI